MNFSHSDNPHQQQLYSTSSQLLLTSRRPRVSSATTCPRPSRHVEGRPPPSPSHPTVLQPNTLIPAEPQSRSTPRIKSTSTSQLLRSPATSAHNPSQQPLPWNASASPLANHAAPSRPALSTRHSTPAVENGTERPKMGPSFLPCNKPPKAKSLSGVPEQTQYSRPVSNTVVGKRVDRASPNTPPTIAHKAGSDGLLSVFNVSYPARVTRSERNCSVSDHGEIFPLSRAVDCEEGSVETHWSDSGSELASKQRNWRDLKEDDQKSEETTEDDPMHAALKIGARKERKMKDLEITNKALLSVNAGLERTIRRQSARIAFLQKELRRNGVTELGDDSADFGHVVKPHGRRNRRRRKKKSDNYGTIEDQSGKTPKDIAKKRQEADRDSASNQPNGNTLSSDASCASSSSSGSEGTSGSCSDPLPSGARSGTDVALERVCTAVEKLVLEGRRAVERGNVIRIETRDTT